MKRKYNTFQDIEDIAYGEAFDLEMERLKNRRRKEFRKTIRAEYDIKVKLKRLGRIRNVVNYELDSRKIKNRIKVIVRTTKRFIRVVKKSVKKFEKAMKEVNKITKEQS